MAKRTLTYQEAEMLLPDGDRVHTFVQAPTASETVLVGADWDRADILNIFKQITAGLEPGAVELSGEAATATGHGIVVDRGPKHQPLFVATNDAVAAFDQVKEFTES